MVEEELIQVTDLNWVKQNQKSQNQRTQRPQMNENSQEINWIWTIYLLPIVSHPLKSNRQLNFFEIDYNFKSHAKIRRI